MCLRNPAASFVWRLTSDTLLHAGIGPQSGALLSQRILRQSGSLPLSAARNGGLAVRGRKAAYYEIIN